MQPDICLNLIIVKIKWIKKRSILRVGEFLVKDQLLRSNKTIKVYEVTRCGTDIRIENIERRRWKLVVKPSSPSLGA